MPPITRGAFHRRVSSLSEEAFADFVAAVWKARGREVARVPGAVLALNSVTGDTEQLRISARGEGITESGDPPDLDRDRYVSARRTGGSRLPLVRPGSKRSEDTVTSDDLHRILHFAITAQTADRIAMEYLGVPFHRDPPPAERDAGQVTPDRTGAWEALQTVGRLARPRTPSRGLVLVGVTLLLLAGVLGVTALQNAPPAPTASGAPERTMPAEFETPTAIPDPAQDSRAETAFPGVAESGGNATRIERPRSPEAYPSGLGPDGIVDADLLAANHTAALRDEPYILEITHREFLNGQPTGLARETITVASPREYVAEVGRVGSLRNDPLVIADASAFADGQYRYERLQREDRVAYLRKSPGLLRDGLSGQDRYLTRAGAYISWFLSVEDSWIAGASEQEGTRYYWVVTEGESFPGYPNARGSALISEHGVVKEFTRTYDDQGVPGGEIQITMRYIRVGNVTVNEPPWAAQARAEVGPSTQTPTGEGSSGNESSTPSADFDSTGDPENSTT